MLPIILSSNFSDLFNLQSNDISKLDRMGEKSAKNIIKAMDIIVKNNKNIHLIICGEGDLKEESELNYLINILFTFTANSSEWDNGVLESINSTIPFVNEIATLQNFPVVSIDKTFINKF